MSEPLAFPQFVQYVAEEMELPPPLPTRDANLVQDLGFDSVRMLELAVLIEELGVFLDDSDLGELQTLAGAYDAYIRRFGGVS